MPLDLSYAVTKAVAIGNADTIPWRRFGAQIKLSKPEEEWAGGNRVRIAYRSRENGGNSAEFLARAARPQRPVTNITRVYDLFVIRTLAAEKSTKRSGKVAEGLVGGVHAPALMLLLSINKSSTKPATICNPDGSLQTTDWRENGPLTLSGCLVASARPACASSLASSRHHSKFVVKPPDPFSLAH
ncbi:hypothetical protein THAOC_07028 [Thalassiosira oceanica]|uniref:Uncharacterized protein n=1 Tax=Thalassiosira oceanica TaxID=159749 RepID=K0SYN4_THAOC|nr:hypothetical protein THAOC_07028 [Thalassiosira oceanica]|eukprot:EJK71523.1 hypothetical protein THAOC_07028 [Thalassiosira oceanica]